MGNHWRANGHRSRALGVHPEQAKKFTEAAQKEGIDVHYDPQTGDMVSHSRKARAAEALRRGFHDNDGGYLEDRYRA